MNSTNPPSSPGASSASTTPLKQAARETAAQVAAAARQTAAQATDSATKYVEEHKATAAERVQAYGTAMHESAKSLERQDPNIAWFAHEAATRLERAASYVRDRDWRGFKDDAESLARRHPAAFFGGMCVAGLILGSVIKASGRSVAESVGREDETDFTSEPEDVPVAEDIPAAQF